MSLAMSMLEPQGEHVLIWGPLAFAVCGLVWLTGIGFGIVALNAAKRGGRRRLLVTAAIGAILDLASIGFAVCVVVGEWTTWQTASELHANIRATIAVKEADQELRNMVLDNYREFQTAASALKNPRILYPAYLKSKDDLQVGIRAIKAFIGEIDNFADSLTNSLSFYAKELTRRGVPDLRRRVALAKFANSLRNDLPEFERFRSAELRFGASFLSIAQFLYDHWGEWKYVSKDEPVHFDQSENMTEYQRLGAEFLRAKSAVEECQKAFNPNQVR